MANKLLTITTPKGIISQVKTADSSIKLEYSWNPGFGPDWTAHLNSVQAMFDQEVLRRTDPYVPMDTGLMKTSPIMASDIGGGRLEWATPYAENQYYNTADTRIYDALRGGHWGDRMVVDNLESLAQFAGKAVGSK